MNTTGFKESVDAAEEAMKTHNAFAAGMRAMENAPNPHRIDTPDYAAWQRGYFSAREAA